MSGHNENSVDSKCKALCNCIPYGDGNVLCCCLLSWGGGGLAPGYHPLSFLYTHCYIPHTKYHNDVMCYSIPILGKMGCLLKKENYMAKMKSTYNMEMIFFYAVICRNTPSDSYPLCDKKSRNSIFCENLIQRSVLTTRFCF